MLGQLSASVFSYHYLKACCSVHGRLGDPSQLSVLSLTMSVTVIVRAYNCANS